MKITLTEGHVNVAIDPLSSAQAAVTVAEQTLLTQTPKLTITNLGYPKNNPKTIPKCTAILLQALAANKVITELQIWQNLSIKEAEILSKALNGQNRNNLTKLTVVGDNRTQALEDGGDNLIKNLLKKTNLYNLEELNLSNCRINDDGALGIATSLEKHPKITKLNLSNNFISAKGANYIAAAIAARANIAIVELDFSNNIIGDSSMVMIDQLVSCKPSFHTLKLNQNQFGDDGSKILANRLKQNQTLRHLEFSENLLMSTKGLNAIVEAARYNPTIKVLKVELYDINSENRNLYNSLQQSLQQILDRNNGTEPSKPWWKKSVEQLQELITNPRKGLKQLQDLIANPQAAKMLLSGATTLLAAITAPYIGTFSATMLAGAGIYYIQESRSDLPKTVAPFPLQNTLTSSVSIEREQKSENKQEVGGLAGLEHVAKEYERRVSLISGANSRS
jgi:hypothetical protein